MRECFVFFLKKKKVRGAIKTLSFIYELKGYALLTIILKAVNLFLHCAWVFGFFSNFDKLQRLFGKIKVRNSLLFNKEQVVLIFINTVITQPLCPLLLITLM